VSLSGGAALTRIGVKVDHDLNQSLNIHAEVGSLKASAFGLSGSDTFVGIGAKIKFGADRGTTFGKRGLLDMIPGL
jgi:hypothetical protein